MTATLACRTDHGEKTTVLCEHRRLGWFDLHKEFASELPAAAGHWRKRAALGSVPQSGCDRNHSFQPPAQSRTAPAGRRNHCLLGGVALGHPLPVGDQQATLRSPERTGALADKAQGRAGAWGGGGRIRRNGDLPPGGTTNFGQTRSTTYSGRDRGGHPRSLPNPNREQNL